MSAPVEMLPWTKPDADGVRTSTDRRRTRRLRRADKKNTSAMSAWPAEWRELAITWLRAGGASVLSKSLLKTSGNLRHLAYDAMEALLVAGWIELEDEFSRGAWVPHRLTWIDAEELRGLLGMRRVDAEKALRDAALADAPTDNRLLPLHASLAARGTKLVLARVPLIQRLDAWVAGERSGTKQEFARFARGDGEVISDDEWAWLAEHVDLEAVGISGNEAEASKA